MRGHTPGPWRINGKKSIRGPKGEYIGHANWKNGEANARLIAAAPELLEALKALHSHTKNDYCVCGLNTMAANAIAKAEGKQ